MEIYTKSVQEIITETVERRNASTPEKVSMPRRLGLLQALRAKHGLATRNKSKEYRERVNQIISGELVIEAVTY